MKRAITQFSILATVMCLSSACLEIRPLSPPEIISASENSQTPQGCKARPIAENIIGTWEFKSTFSGGNTGTRGTIIFTEDKKIIDPDTLFEGNIIGYPAIAKTYEPNAPTPDPAYPGEVFNVYVKTKGGTQTNYFVVVSNECNKVHMRFWQSGSNGVGFHLFRK